MHVNTLGDSEIVVPPPMFMDVYGNEIPGVYTVQGDVEVWVPATPEGYSVVPVAYDAEIGYSGVPAGPNVPQGAGQPGSAVRQVLAPTAEIERGEIVSASYGEPLVSYGNGKGKDKGPQRPAPVIPAPVYEPPVVVIDDRVYANPDYVGPAPVTAPPLPPSVDPATVPAYQTEGPAPTVEQFVQAGNTLPPAVAASAGVQAPSGSVAPLYPFPWWLYPNRPPSQADMMMPSAGGGGGGPTIPGTVPERPTPTGGGGLLGLLALLALTQF